MSFSSVTAISSSMMLSKSFLLISWALTRRDKGPLWLVYPRDNDAVLQDAKYDHRWAWQLSQLLVSDAP